LSPSDSLFLKVTLATALVLFLQSWNFILHVSFFLLLELQMH
jgi:hypothetical protein